MRRDEGGDSEERPAEEAVDDERGGSGRHPDRFDAFVAARRRRAARLVSILVVVVLLMVFIVRNSQRVPVDFVFFTHRARLIWIMLACAVLGGILGFLIGRPGRRFRHLDEKGRRRQED